MAFSEPTQTIAAAVSQLEVLQRRVELQLQHLQGLREQKSQSDFIHNEKDVLEGKLMKFFAKQLFVKISAGVAPYEKEVLHCPNLQQFLYVSDVKGDMVEAINQRCSTVEELCLFSDEKLRGIFYSHNDDEDVAQKLFVQYDRLSTALNILCSFVGMLQNGEKTAELPWTHWNPLPESPSDNRASIANYLQEFCCSPNDNIRNKLKHSSLGSKSIPSSPTGGRRKCSTLPRSRSDEANVGQRVLTESTSSVNRRSIRKRVKSFGGKSKQRPAPIIIPSITDGETDSDHSNSRSSSVSQSPRTPTANLNLTMTHSIKHRFSAKQLLVSITCDYCHRLMFIGLRCKECGFKCHKKCAKKAPPSCSLPEAFIEYFKQALDNKLDGSNDVLKRATSEPSNIVNQVNLCSKSQNRSHDNLQMYKTKELTDDTSSTISSASSTSSSPIQSDSPCTSVDFNPAEFKASAINKFFPDTSLQIPVDDLFESLTSTNSTISTIRSEESTDTFVNSEDSGHSKSSIDTKTSESTIDEPDAIDELHTQISDVIPNHVRLRERGSLMSEWVIPYRDIEVNELIGEGRVGKVYRARWHGEVALKVLYLESQTTEERNDFKYKVQVLRRTRHENLILFMGACMEPPTLAIVCSLCKGKTLHQHIHGLGTTFEDVKLIDIIKQISHGMSYLHAKGIVHRDLKTKNIFLEANKIVITDFGLISIADMKVTNSKRPNELIVPRGWLCYQAPEIIRKLDPCNPGAEVPHYTNKTDIYAFGSVWFELLAGMWPFDNQPSEAIIWQIGKGLKQSLGGLQISREMKDILSMIWAFDSDVRPSFSTLLEAIKTLPKRKLIRSPSQPTYMTRYVNALI